MQTKKGKETGGMKLKQGQNPQVNLHFGCVLYKKSMGGGCKEADSGGMALRERRVLEGGRQKSLSGTFQ